MVEIDDVFFPVGIAKDTYCVYPPECRVVVVFHHANFEEYPVIDVLRLCPKAELQRVDGQGRCVNLRQNHVHIVAIDIYHAVHPRDAFRAVGGVVAVR